MNQDITTKRETPGQPNDKAGWLPMSEAAKLVPYSAEYLSLLARKGKLTSKKIGNVWYTTKPVLDAYMHKQMLREQIQNGSLPPVRTFYGDMRGLGVDITPPAPKADHDLKESEKESLYSSLKKLWDKDELAPTVFLPAMNALHGEEKKSGGSRNTFSALEESVPTWIAEKRERHEATLQEGKRNADLEEVFEKVLDRKMPVSNGVQQVSSPRKIIYKEVFTSRTLVAVMIVSVISFTLLPVPIVFSFFEKSFTALREAVNDSNTVMGFRPGTHANEILLLDKEGNVSIMGHIETEGQLRSFVADGVAPIVVDSMTMVENLNAEFVGGVSANEFTLAFVTENGNVTTQDVVFEGKVEVGETLRVRGATELQSALSVGGRLSVFGKAEFRQALDVLGPAYFESLVTLQSDLVAKGDIRTDGNLTVRKNISTRGSIEAGSSIIGKSGSFGSLGVSGNLSAGGKITLGNPDEVMTVNSENFTLNSSGDASFSGSVNASGISGSSASFTTLTATNSTTTNATSTNLYAEFATFGNINSGTIILSDINFTNATGTNATTTNFFSENANFTNLAVSDLDIDNLTFENSTGTNATTTNFFSGAISGLIARITSIIADDITTDALTAVNSTTTNATTTNLFSENATFTNLTSSGTVNLTNFTFENATGTSATTTNLFSSQLTTNNLQFTNATGTNATTTNFFSTTASSTNLFSTNFNLGTGTLGSATSTNLFSSNLSSNLLSVSGLATLNNLTATGDTSLQGLTFTNATGTSATTTNLFSTNATFTTLTTVNTELENATITSATIGDLTFTNATGTNATTTNLFSTTGRFNSLYTSLTAGSVPFIGANGLLTENNSQFFWDNSTQRLGIGTTEPLEMLHISGANPDIFLSRPSNTNGANVDIDTSISTNTANIFSRIRTNRVDGTNSTLSLSTLQSGTLTEVMRLTQAGNVGIGTTTPARTLHVEGTSRFITTTAPQMQIGTSATEVDGTKVGTYFYTRGINNVTGGIQTTFRGGIAAGNVDLDLFAGGDVTTPKLTIEGTGNVGIGTTNPGALLELGSPALGMRLGLYTGSNIGIGIQNNLVEFIGNNTNVDFTFGSGTSGSLSRVMTIEGTGNVGVGAINPLTRLHLKETTGPIITLERDDTTLTTNDLIGGTNFYINDADMGGAAVGASIGAYVAAPITSSNMFTDLRFFTSAANEANTERMRINYNGNVGIGVTTAVTSAKLHTLSASNSVGAAIFENTGTNIFNQTPVVTIKQSGDTAVNVPQHYLLDLDYAGDASGVTGTYMRMLTGGTERYSLGLVNDEFVITRGTTPTEALRIDVDGNVGIGTTNPQARLHILNTTGDEVLRLDDTSDTSNPFMSFYQNGTRRSYIQHNDIDNDLRINSEYGKISLWTGTTGSNEAERLTVDSSGNVGIGLTNPSERLHVSGNLLVTGNSTTTNATTTNFFSTNARFTTLFTDTLDVTDLLFVNATGTNATTTNLYSAGFRTLLANITSLIADDATVGALTATNATSTNLEVTNSTTLNNVSVSGTINTALTPSRLVVTDASGVLTAGTNVITAANVLTSVSGTTGTAGNLVFSTSPTLTTPIIANIRGGTAAGSTLTLRSTSGVGTTDAIIFQTGSSVEKMRITSSGNVGIGTTTPSVKFSVGGAAGDTTGHGYFTGGLGIGVVNTTAGTLRTSGDAYIGGSLTIAGSAVSSATTGQFQFLANPTGTLINEGTVYINPTSAGTNNVLLGVAVNGVDKLRVDAEGDVQIVGLFNSTNALGTNSFSGGLSVLEDVALGTDSSNTLTVNSRISSNLIPSVDNTYSLGAPALRWANFYSMNAVFDSISTASSTEDTFIINSDNATADAEDASLQFSRGTEAPNAIIKWDSTLKRFDFNNFPVHLQNKLVVSGTASSSFAGPLWVTGTPLGTGLSQGSLYINPASGSTNYTLFGIGVAGVERFRVDAEGDTTIRGSLGVENALFDITEDTLTIDDKLQIMGNEIKDSTGTTRISLGSTNTITGNLVVSGDSTTTALTISSLTSGRVPFASTGGLLTDSSLFTFDSAVGRLSTVYASTTALSSTGFAHLATSGGSVGVGTTEPLAKFVVNDAVSGTTVGAGIVARMQGANNTNARTELGFSYAGASGTYTPVLIGYQSTSHTGWTSGNFYIATRNVTTDDAPVERLTILPGGNVGIGTTNPSVAKLQVAGDSYITGGLGVGATDLTSGVVNVGTGFRIGNAAASNAVLRGNGSSFVSSAAQALTKTDDTNVTLTLGGTPATALLDAVSLTLGWTGQLSVARGGTGVGSFTENGVLYGNGTSAIQATAAGTSGSVLTSDGGAPSFSTSPTLATSLTTPLVIGGTGANSVLALRSTSGVGTTDSIRFQVGNNGATEAMRIITDGKVGIGTTEPISALSVDRALSSTALGDGVALRLQGAAAANARTEIGLTYSGASGSYTPVLLGYQATSFTESTKGSFYIATRDVTTDTAPVERLTILPSGNVGVGVTNPDDKLQVNGSLRVTNGTGGLHLRSLGTAIGFNRNTDDGTIFDANGHAYQINHTKSTTNTSDYLAFQVYNTAGTAVTTSGLVLNGAGNVGIGITNPGAKLDITGADDAAGTLGAFRIRGTAAGTTDLRMGVANTGSYAWINAAQPGVGLSRPLVLQAGTGAGNVGIGSTTPLAKLSVYETAQVVTDLVQLYTANWDAGATWATGKVQFFGNWDGTSADIMNVEKDSSPIFKINRLGNVGIGTTNPLTSLVVNEGTLNYAFDSTGVAKTTALIANDLNDVSRGALGIAYATYGQDRRSGISFLAPASAADSDLSRRAFFGTSQANSSGSTISDFVWWTGVGSMTEKMRLTSAGNVGIGTTNPSTFKLEVAGNVGPEADNTRDLGSSGRRFANIYGTNVFGTGATLSGLTQGSVVFAGTGGALSQDNANFFWNNTTKRLGIGTSSGPASVLDIRESVVGGITEIRQTNIATANTTNQIGIEHRLNTDSTTRTFFRLRTSATDIVDASRTSLVEFITNDNGGFGTRMAIHGSNVGIGTTTPLTKLNISASAGAVESGTATPNGIFSMSAYPNTTVMMTSGLIGGASAHVWFQGRGINNTNTYPIVFNPSGGNVGVGTTSPAAQFAVSSVSTSVAQFSTSNNNDAHIFLSSGSAGQTNWRLRATGSGVGSDFFSIGEVGQNYLTILDGGNVGIGRTDPSRLLHVFSSTGSSQGITAESSNGAGGAIALIEAKNNGGNTAALRMFGTGFTTSGLNIANYASLIASSGADGLVINTQGTGDPLLFGTNSIERMRVDGDGNVGIGTTTPSSALDLYKVLSSSGTISSITGRNSGANVALTGLNIDLVNSSSATTIRQSGINVGVQNLTGAVTGINADATTAFISGATTRASYGGKFTVSNTNVTTSSATNISYFGVRADATGGPAGESSSVYGGYFRGIGQSTGSTVYGLYATASGGTDNYGIYSAAGTNYFNGNVGIGTTTPASQLHISNSTGSTLTIGGNTNVLLGDQLSAFDTYSLDSSTSMTGVVSRIRTIAEADFVSSQAKTSLVFHTNTGVAGSLAEAMRLTSDGKAHFGPTDLFGQPGRVVVQDTAPTAGESLTLTTNSNISSSILGINFVDRINATSQGAEGQKSAFIQSIRNASSARFDLAFGTSDGTDLAADATEKMRILGSGNVGIGLTAPATTLDLLTTNNAAGGIRMQSSLSDATNKNARIKVGHYTNAEEPVTMLMATAANGANLVYIGGGTAVENAATKLSFFTAGNSTTLTGTERMTIDASGNVGIGTTTPANKLDVYGGNISLSNNQGLEIYNAAGSATVTAIKLGTSNELRLRNGAVVVDSSGNVGIGTTNPTTKLQISGGDRLFFDGGITGPTDITQDHRGILLTNRAMNVTSKYTPGLMFGSTDPDFTTTNPKMMAAILGYATRAYGADAYAGMGLEFFTTPITTVGGETLVPISRMIIDGDGNVGIGTTDPQAKLDVAGSLLASSVTASSSNQVGIFTDTRTNIHTLSSSVKVQNTGDTDVSTLSHRLLDLDYAGDASGVTGTYVRFLTGGTERAGLGLTGDKFTITTGVAERLTVDSSGNVGIGTTAPDHKLHVHTGSDGIIASFSGAVANRGLHISTGLAEGSGSALVDFGVTSGSTVGVMTFSTDGNERVRINKVGNVGIGTTGPLAKLHVESAATDTQLKISQTATGFAPASILLEGSQADSRGQGIFHYNTQSDTSWFTGVPYNIAGAKWVVGYESNGTWDPAVAQIDRALFTVQNNGNVGVGTTAPSGLLHLAKDDNFDVLMQHAETATAGSRLIFQRARGTVASPANIGSTDTLGEILVQAYAGGYDDTAAIKFQADGTFSTVAPTRITFFTTAANTASAERMRIDSSGNVGIGTTTPSRKLSVNGDVGWYGANTSEVGRLFATDTSNAAISATNALAFYVADGGVRAMHITSAGNVGIGTTTPNAPLTIESSTAAIQLSSTSGTAPKWDIAALTADGRLDFREGYFGSSPSTRFTIAAGGNVGIGTHAPGQKLEIENGNLWIDSNSNVYTTLDRSAANRRNNLVFVTAGDSTEAVPTTGLDWVLGTADSDELGDGSAFFIGKSNSAALAKMVIDSAGNVGIGTTTPARTLSVSSGLVDVVTTFSSTDTNAILSLMDGTTTADDYVGIGANGNDLRLRAGGSAHVTVSSTGNVGIGTTNPQSSLHVLALGTAGTPSLPTGTVSAFQRSSSAGAAAYIGVISGNAGLGRLFFGDTDSAQQGVVEYDHSTNNLNLYTSGSQKMTILSSGNVGIGTTTPSGKLYVLGSHTSSNANTFRSTGANWLDMIRDDATTDNNFIRFNSTTNGTNTWSIGTLLGTDDFYINENTASNPRFVIQDGGNVGIGTTTPSSLLYVYGSSNDAIATLQNTSTAGGDGLHIITADGGTTADRFGLKVTTNSLDRFTIINNGNVGIGTTTPAENLTVNGSIQFGNVVSSTGSANAYNSGRLGGYNSGAAPFTSYSFIQPAKNKALVIWNANSNIVAAFGQAGSDTNTNTYLAGNVGIGTTNPLSRLEIGANGSANEVLTIRSQANAGIEIYADTDNVNEAHNAYLLLSQDGGGVQSILGLSGGTNLDPQGGAYTGALSNATLLGTLDANGPLQLGTNDNVRLTIDTSGNVGIGITNPSNILYAQRDQNADTAIRVHNASAGTSARSYLQVTNNTSSGYLMVPGTAYTGVTGWANRLVMTTDSGVTNGILLRAAAGGIQLSASGLNNPDIFVNTSGNVGIGTTNPQARQHNVITSRATAFNAADGSTWQDLVIQNPNTGLNAATGIAFQLNATYHTNAGTGIAAVKSTALDYDADLAFITRPNAAPAVERMRITSTGNVGIGTTNPGSLLTLNGTAATTHQRFSEAGSTIGFVGGANGLVTGQTGTFAVRGETGLALSGQGNAANIFINSSGNVGIGTTNPTYRLTLKSPAANTVGLAIEEAGSTQLSLTAYEGTSSQGVINWYDGANAITNKIQGIGDSYITSGNVGIGVTNPGAILHTFTDGDRTARFESSDAYSGIELKDSVGSSYLATASGKLYLGHTFAASATNNIVIDASGNLGIGLTNPTSKLQVAGGNVDIDNNQFYRALNSSGAAVAILGLETDNILRIRGTSSAIRFDQGATERMRIDTGGNVGIGTTAPLAALQVDKSLSGTTVGAGTVLRLQGASAVNARTEIGFSYAGSGGTHNPAVIGYQSTTHTGSTMGNFYIATRAVTTDTAPTERLVIDTAGNVNIVGGDVQTAGTTRITNAGALTNITGITSSGTITFSGLTANRLVATNASSQLVAGTNVLTAANLLTSISGTTGTAGNLVFSTSPTFTGTVNAAAITMTGVLTNSSASASAITLSGGSAGINFTNTSGTKTIATGGTTNLNLAPGGNVGIGQASPNAKLDVNGTILAGDTTSTSGSLILAGQYGGATDDFINTFGGHYSTAGTVIGYATKPKSGAAGYVSSADNVSWARGVSVLDSSGFHIRLGASQAVAVGSDVSMTEYFTIRNSDGNVGINDATPTNKLDVAGSIGISDTTVIDASRNLVNIGTITSGLINGQTISSAANFTGTLATASTMTEAGSPVVSNADIDTCAEFIALVVSTGTCGSAVFSVSPALTGTPTAPTAAVGTNTTQLATTAFVQADAVSINTANRAVRRDGSGNFAAGTITATLSGNASTATTLQTTRTIWGQNFNGSANVSGALSGATTGNFSGLVTAGGFRTNIATTDYTHITRSGGGAALYVNQVDGVQPIMRLSSGTATANNGVVLTVENNGDVGIGGVTSPAARLTVEEALSGTGVGAGTVVRLQGANTTNARTEIGFTYSGASAVNAPAVIGYQSTTHTGSTMGNFYIATRAVTTDTAPTERLTVLPGGNVGIGTTNPASFTLEVAGNIGPDGDNTRDLGSPSRRYANFYAVNFDTSSLTVSGLAPSRLVATDGSSNLVTSISAANLRLSVDSGQTTGTGNLVFATSPIVTGLSVSSGGMSVTGNSTIAGTLTSLTGLTSSGTITFSGLTAARNVCTTTGGQLTVTCTSANLANSLTDEQGTGSVVFSNSPILTTPNIGAATGSSLNLGAGTITSGLINGQTISATANLTGTLDVAGITTFGTYMKTDYNNVRTFENVAQYHNGDAINTGTIVITIGSTPNMMIDAEIAVQGYNGLRKFQVRGYTFTGSANWHQPMATCVSSGAGDCTVRFGKVTATGERVIMLGTTSTSWGNYPHVAVTRVTRGYPSSGDIGNWSIAIVTDESAYTVGTTPNINSGFTASGAILTGVPTAPTAAVGTNTTQLATTAFVQADSTTANTVNRAVRRDGSGNILTGTVNAQTISTAANFTGTMAVTTQINTPFYRVNAAVGNGVCFWNDCTNYKIHMGNTAEYQYGPVTDYSIKNTMNSTAGRGWTWGQPGVAPIAALGNTGNFQVAGTGNFGGIVSTPEINPNGAFALTINGNNNNNLILTTDQNMELITNGTTGSYFFKYGNDERMRIVGSTGNVGIGTTTPPALLTVGTVAGGQAAQMPGDFRIGDWSGAGVAYLQARDYTASSIDMRLRTQLSGGVVDVMTLKSSGDVGIGVTNPSAKLDVRSGHLNVSDSVFSNPGSWGSTIYLDNANHSRLLVNERASGVQVQVAAHTGSLARVGTVSAHSLRFTTGGASSDRMTIDTSGNVGIGITNPNSKLHVAGGAAQVGTTASAISYATRENVLIFNRGDLPTSWLNKISSSLSGTNSDTTLNFELATGASTHVNVMTLNAVGRVGIGVTNPSELLDVAGNIKSSAWIGRVNAGAPSADAAIFRAADNTLAFSTASAERLRINGSGNIGFGTTDIEAWSALKAIEATNTSIAFGTVTDIHLNSNVYNDSGGWKYKTTDEAANYYLHQGTHNFRVAASGTINTAVTWTNAMVIDNSGNVGIGLTNPGAKLTFAASTTQTGGIRFGTDVTLYRSAVGWLDVTGSLGAGSYLEGGTDVCTGGGTCLNSVSDMRLKENIVSIESSLSKVMQLNPVTFEWNDTYREGRPDRFIKEGANIGFIAQEVDVLFPELVNHANPNGFLSVDYEKFVPILTKAIQELSGKVTYTASTTEAAISDLDARVVTLETEDPFVLDLGLVTFESATSTEATTTLTFKMRSSLYDTLVFAGVKIGEQIVYFAELATEKFTATLAYIEKAFIKDLYVERQLCVDDVCVDKEQLKQMLINAGGGVYALTSEETNPSSSEDSSGSTATTSPSTATTTEDTLIAEEDTTATTTETTLTTTDSTSSPQAEDELTGTGGPEEGAAEAELTTEETATTDSTTTATDSTTTDTTTESTGTTTETVATE